MKALLDGRSQRILGFSYTALRDAIFTPPTMAEGLNVLLANPPPPAG